MSLHPENFERIKATMVEMFELEPGLVTPQARVFEDLDLDSIDAIDLVARLQATAGSGARVDEEALRSVRTVSDIVALAESLGFSDAQPVKQPATG